MRVEKTGTGDSEGPACTSPAADFQAEIRAYTAGLRALKHYAFVDPDAVFVIGLSIGGVEAPFMATAERMSGVVVINTVAKPFFEYLLDSRRRQMTLGHLPYDEIDRSMAVDERCNHRLLVEKEPPDAILASSPECADHIAYPAPFTFMQQWAESSSKQSPTGCVRSERRKTSDDARMISVLLTVVTMAEVGH